MAGRHRMPSAISLGQCLGALVIALAAIGGAIGGTGAWKLLQQAPGVPPPQYARIEPVPADPVPPIRAVTPVLPSTKLLPPPAPTLPMVVEAPKPEPEPAPSGCSTTGFGGVKPHVAQVGHHLALRFGVDETAVGGLAGRAGPSDHPLGLALDVPAVGEVGDRIAAYVLANKTMFAVTYVIWKQRINQGTTDADWQLMEDRGSVTANHFDHVHISFSPIPSGQVITC